MPDPASVQELADAINAADKVAIFAGAGVEGAHDEVIALAGAVDGADRALASAAKTSCSTTTPTTSA